MKDMSLIENAISKREREYSAALDRLRNEGIPDQRDFEALREVIELARCLRRLVRGRTVEEIHFAFGAPGDFGYESLIGNALCQLYQQATLSSEDDT